jgi:hypothetical protein
MSNKYCIYNRYNDIEVWEYIDDLEEACSYWYVKQAIDKYGVESMMPIVMNKCGGYHTFYKPDCVAIIESDTWPNFATHRDLFTIRINNPNFDYGWIDLEGNTFSCKYMEHASFAKDLVAAFYPVQYTRWKQEQEKEWLDAPDDFLLDIGWIKVLKGEPAQIYIEAKTSDAALIKLLEVKGNKHGNTFSKGT